LKPVLETDRLRLREFTLDDLDDLAAMVGDEDQMRFYGRLKTRDEAAAWIARNLTLYEERGFGIWLIEAARAPGFAGYCGIRPLALGAGSETEIGWHVHKTCWNHGFATEAAVAVRDLAFGRLGLERLVALVPPAHCASRRVAAKIGMREEGTTLVEGEPVLVFAAAPPPG
jgi:RimJ/RimL family protein N-acetyltransferase